MKLDMFVLFLISIISIISALSFSDINAKDAFYWILGYIAIGLTGFLIWMWVGYKDK